MIENILDIALSVTGTQCFDYLAFIGRKTNAIGNDVASYADPVQLEGSVQPVSRTLMIQQGLDMQRRYKTFFVSAEIMDVDRDVSGDQFVFEDDTYQCLSITDWFSFDGWTSVLAVRVPGQC